MRNHITLIILLAGTSMTTAQQLHPNVVATNGGHEVSANVSLDWTLGELATSSYKGASQYLTEGFHQPYLNVILGFDQPISPKNEDGLSLPSISLSPNPTSGDMTLHLPASGVKGYVLQILDASGHPMLTQREQSETSVNIDVSHLAPGLYFVMVTVPAENLRSIFKITKI